VNLASTRILTDDVARLVGFYERATGVRADWSTPEFAELRTARATLAIAGTRTAALFVPDSPDAVRAGTNRSVIVEFLVDDVDVLHGELGSGADPGIDVVTGPTTMPWGNRSLLVRDPDGNLVNFFAPVTPEAVQRAAR
jgi:catechol 2,3-dioxygenase-like lactoylglutathione lyase family enzyme